jgi:hypothetical protein
MMRNHMRVRSAKTVRLMKYEIKCGMRVMLQPRLRIEMNAQGVNGKLMEDAQRSSSGRGIFWRR